MVSQQIVSRFILVRFRGARIVDLNHDVPAQWPREAGGLPRADQLLWQQNLYQQSGLG